MYRTLALALACFDANPVAFAERRPRSRRSAEHESRWSMCRRALHILAPKSCTKGVKNALEQQSCVEGRIKIGGVEENGQPLSSMSFHVRTEEGTANLNASDVAWLKLLGLNEYTESIRLIAGCSERGSTPPKIEPLRAAIETWLLRYNPSDHKNLEQDLNDLYKSANSFTVYGSMLLFSAGAFQDPTWERLFRKACESQQKQLYKFIANAMNVTHVAVNAPIPPQDTADSNVLRSPINFNPLLGDFGTTTCSSPPIEENFDKAYWTTAKQNGIVQTWAPRWTMFSRGNISEKARIIHLPSVRDAVEQGKADGLACAAVDLYAGIGYFAFSYAKAGVSKILCWDLNPWSIEGLRRGAAANKWRALIYQEGRSSLEDMTRTYDARLLVFNESNNLASSRIKAMRRNLPPIRHVNCGLLPTSQGSWATAVDALDAQMGGWVHVHENFAVDEITAKAEEVRRAFQALLGSPSRIAAVEHVQRVKSYAPGVIHCVVDIFVSPRSP